MDINFPDIRDALYASKSMEEFLNKYNMQLLQCPENRILMLQYANKIKWAYSMISSDQFKSFDNPDLPSGDSFIEKLCDFLSEWAEINNCYVRLTWRPKHWLKYHKKVRTYLINARPLSRLLDLIGVRITIGEEMQDSRETLNLCYKFATDFEIFISEVVGACFLDADSRNSEEETFFNADVDVDSICICKELTIPKATQNNYKDYIRYPKANGYQSLHHFSVLPSGVQIETQIRTLAMDNRAEIGPCSHENHDTDKYVIDFEDLDYIDPSKVRIPKFWVKRIEQYNFGPRRH